MDLTAEGITDLVKLNQVAETLNRAVDVRSLLDETLSRLVDLLSLKTAWIVLKRQPGLPQEGTSQFELAAHINLPPALAPHLSQVWGNACDCQRLCSQGQLAAAVNLVHCSRLALTNGMEIGFTKHASVPLRSGSLTLGILNVAAPDGEMFDPRALALLTNIGHQMGIALERARLYDLLREKRVLEQTALLSLTNELLVHSNLEDLLSLVVREVPGLLEADACAVLLPANGDDSFEFRAVHGWRQNPTGQRVAAPPTALAALQAGLPQSYSLEASLPPVHGSLLPLKMLRDEGFKTHVAVALMGDGSPTGLLYLDHRTACHLDEGQTRFLNLLANQAAIAIEQARLREEQELQRRTQLELDLGRKIQVSLLPESPPSRPGWEFALAYRAAHHLSGDFYDFFEHSHHPDWLGIVIADVGGKGVPASILMAVSRTVLRAAALTKSSPADALKRANTLLRKDNRVSYYLSAFYSVLNLDTGRMTYANAGHNLPLWMRTGRGACSQLVADGKILGIFDEFDPEEKEIDIEEGDFLVFYTDGFSEAFSPDNREFGWERLKELCIQHRFTSAQRMLDSIMQAVDAFSGDAVLSDDQTLFIVKREAMGPSSGI